MQVPCYERWGDCSKAVSKYFKISKYVVVWCWWESWNSTAGPKQFGIGNGRLGREHERFEPTAHDTVEQINRNVQTLSVLGSFRAKNARALKELQMCSFKPWKKTTSVWRPVVRWCFMVCLQNESKWNVNSVRNVFACLFYHQTCQRRICTHLSSAVTVSVTKLIGWEKQTLRHRIQISSNIHIHHRHLLVFPFLTMFDPNSLKTQGQ